MISSATLCNGSSSPKIILYSFLMSFLQYKLMLCGFGFSAQKVFVALVIQGPKTYFFSEVGEFTTIRHRVGGSVFIVSEDTLKIENFNYDGTGPNSFFVVGKKGASIKGF